MSLSVVDFGRQLVETEDLDPVYVMLYKAELDRETLYKWLLAYWCFYHCGTSSWIVDGKFEERLLQAAETAVHPRGTERRHFRGRNGVDSVKWILGYPKGWRFMVGAFDEFEKSGSSTRLLADVMAYVQTWKGFGPWIAFKVADMLERLGICRINFSEADTFLFDSPKEGAGLVVQHYSLPQDHVSEYESPAWAFDYLDTRLGHLKAPPRYERTLNGQEYETILCKWKSHLNGHYEVGHDIHEIRQGLLKYSRWPTAQRLLKTLPKVPER